jgi:hypothetical protein
VSSGFDMDVVMQILMYTIITFCIVWPYLPNTLFCRFTSIHNSARQYDFAYARPNAPPLLDLFRYCHLSVGSCLRIGLNGTIYVDNESYVQ